MFANSIPKEDIKHLPLIKFEGTIHTVETMEALDEALKIIRTQEIMGFDTETKPTFTKGDYNHTAIIQLSTMTDAFIIRISEIGIPDQLKDILEDQGILKVGISIRDDIKELKAMRAFKAGGFLDLNEVAKELGITQIGMKSLTGIFLKARISKSQQTSNWETKELSPGQLSYAATDAWVCIKIYRMLMDKGVI
jgi:ribonuclease D